MIRYTYNTENKTAGSEPRAPTAGPQGATSATGDLPGLGQGARWLPPTWCAGPSTLCSLSYPAG